MINLLFYSFLFLLIVPFVGYLIILIQPFKKEGIKLNTHLGINGISIIIPCYNEEIYIENKINEILNLCLIINPICFEIIIISDGPTDSTNEILKKYSTNRNIKVFEFNQRGGKANALNFGVSKSQFDILIFSDVRQTIKKGSFNVLLSHFSDPIVGAVSAKIEHAGSSQIRNFINYLKLLENKTGSTIGVYGALYAIRKNNYIPIPVSTILDDLLISLNVLSQGKLVKFETEAIVYDIEIEKFYSKKRTLRLISGLFQLAFVNTGVIFKLSFKNIFFLFFQKYFKLILPLTVIAIPLFAYISDGFYSLKFQTVCIIWIFSALMILFGRKKMTIKFILRMIYFYILSFNPYKKRDTVLWDK